jgi:hypothetical protein
MKRILAALAAFSVVAMIAMAEDAPPLIRDFEPAVTEVVGVHMYRQDQFAWKATDILLAKHSAEELRAAKAHGWIVVEGENRNVVRFIRDGAEGPEAAYDVTFGLYGTTELTEPSDRTLPPEQLAQYRARLAALENFDFRCTNTPPNSIAFEDAPGGDWHVWVMTATTDPKLTILGGHIRYTISADGKSVLSKEKLAKGCGLFGDGERNGEKPALQYFKDIVSLKPLESHVFANLAYRIPLFIGTTDGVIWKIDQGMIKSVDLDAPGADGYTARAAAGSDEECRLVLEKIIGDEKKYVVGGEIKVITSTEGDARFSPSAPSGSKVAAITCTREDVVPAPNDYKVLLAGYPLYIFDSGRGHPDRNLTLVVVNGQLKIEFKDGQLMPGEQARMQKRLDAMQTAFNNAAKK